jgi:dienelactone hydrolase
MAAGGAVIERPFTIPRSDGTTIHGDLRLPEGETPLSAVVVAHGFKGFKDWGFFPHLCECLAQDGHAVVSFNFSLNGIGDDPTEFTELESFARNTFTRDVDEILLVLEQVRNGGILSVPPTRLGLFGHSRGGGEAVVAARDDARLDALVTWAGLATFERWPEDLRKEWRAEGRIHVLNARTGQQMPLDVTLLEDFESNRDRLDIEAAAATLQDVPWLIVHGEADASVPISDADRLAAANPKVRVERIPSAGHAFEALHPFQGSTAELDRAIGATSQHLRRYLVARDEPG